VNSTQVTRKQEASRRVSALGVVMRVAALAVSLLCALLPAAEPAGASPPSVAEPPAARPPASDASAKAEQLFAAILRDDPAAAAGVFFPRDAFLLVKDMLDPGRYYDRLLRQFDKDLHALHASISAADREHAKFERFVLADRGGWVKPREEGNKLPYWASRHSFIHYRVRDQPRKLEVRVMISWQDHWYVIHLSPIERPTEATSGSPVSH
jgi:hypothetical protein